MPQPLMSKSNHERNPLLDPNPLTDQYRLQIYGTVGSKVQDVFDDYEFGEENPKTDTELIKRLILTSYPITIALVLEVACNFVSLYFASRVHGNIGSGIIFAGISLATLYANVSCYSIQEGMSGAVETLGSQANGAGEFKTVGNVLMRCIVILSLITIPLVATWPFVDDVFNYLGVADDICKVIEGYLMVRLYGVPFDIIGLSYDKYLMAIGVVDPAMYSSIAFNLFLIVFCYIFIFISKLDYTYIAWAYVMATAVRMSSEIGLSLQYPQVRETLYFPSMEVFRDWRAFFDLGIPSSVMLCAEWWAYEILTVFASLISADAVDAQTIILQISVLAFMFSYGIGVASASIVGNAIGAGNMDLAKRSGRLALLVILFVDVVLAASLLTAGPLYVRVLTSNDSIIRTTCQLLPFLSVFIILDGLQGVISGILRGAGKQNVGALLGFVSYYAIGLPMAWLLTFNYEVGVGGLIIGISAGSVLQVLVLLVILFFYSDFLYSPRNVDRRGSFEYYV